MICRSLTYEIGTSMWVQRTTESPWYIQCNCNSWQLDWSITKQGRWHLIKCWGKRYQLALNHQITNITLNSFRRVLGIIFIISYQEREVRLVLGCKIIQTLLYRLPCCMINKHVPMQVELGSGKFNSCVIREITYTI